MATPERGTTKGGALMDKARLMYIVMKLLVEFDKAAADEWLRTLPMDQAQWVVDELNKTNQDPELGAKYIVDYFRAEGWPVGNLEATLLGVQKALELILQTGRFPSGTIMAGDWVFMDPPPQGKLFEGPQGIWFTGSGLRVYSRGYPRRIEDMFTIISYN